MSGDMVVGLFEVVDESESSLNSLLFEVVFNSLFNVLSSQSPRDD